MKKENSVLAAYEAPTSRITRARAAACRASGPVLALKPLLVKSDKKPGQRGKTKRDENSYAAPTAAFQHKKRAVLRDVTNVCCENSLKGFINATKIQAMVSQRIKLVPSKAKSCSDKKVSNPAPAISVGNALILENKKNEHVESFMDGESTCDTALVEKHTLREGRDILCQTNHVKDNFCKNLRGLSELDYIDIDSDHSNPQMCCLYSADIYTNLRAAELLRRPCSNFMETMQRDLTRSMLGILIDWLVEVSDEYKLVLDTLYLTVNIIDRFLSQNYIEGQRLQLLGITCMLIASMMKFVLLVWKNFALLPTTHTPKVLKREIDVLSFLGFQLSLPTIKTFLSFFVQEIYSSSTYII